MTVLAILRAACQARRAKDHSPAIHRWGTQGKKQNQSRQGRKNTPGWVPPYFRPWRGLAWFRPGHPTVKTVGYGRSSLRDYPAWRAGPGSPGLSRCLIATTVMHPSADSRFTQEWRMVQLRHRMVEVNVNPRVKAVVPRDALQAEDRLHER